MGKVKVVGERHTGTNYLESLIKINSDYSIVRSTCPNKVRRVFNDNERLLDLWFGVLPRQFFWKHKLFHYTDMLHLERKGITLLALTKSPYSWLLSMYRKPYHCQSRASTLTDFLKDKWLPVGREGVSRHKISAIELWNIKNKAYFSMAEKNPNFHVIKYEDLLVEPDKTISKVLNDISEESFSNVRESSKAKEKNYNRKKDNLYYRDYYLNERWRRDFSKEDISIVNDKIDVATMRDLGYEVIDAS